MNKYGTITHIDGKLVNIQFHYESSDDKKVNRRNRDKAMREAIKASKHKR